MIKGTEKEKKNYTKQVGMFNANVVAVNPTKDELGKLLNATLDKEIEYTSTNDSGDKKVTLSFWLKEVEKGNLFNVRFNLEDKEKVSQTGKPQFINSIGMTSYAESKDKVPNFVTENGKELRNAKVGEELLYTFLRSWLNNLDYENPNTELMLDWKSLMKGKVNELREAIDAYKDEKICCMATVRTALDGKEYQGVYSYAFLPSFALECFLGHKKNYKSVDKFIEKVTDPQHGCKDYFELVPLKDYNPKDNILSSNDPILNKKSNEEQKVKNTSNVEVNEMEESEIDDLPF